jgi:hypothetical protein
VVGVESATTIFSVTNITHHISQNPRESKRNSWRNWKYRLLSRERSGGNGLRGYVQGWINRKL